MIRPPYLLAVFFVAYLIGTAEKSFRERGSHIDIIKNIKTETDWAFGSLFVRLVGYIYENLLKSVY